MTSFQRLSPRPTFGLAEQFGVRSSPQVRRDVRRLLGRVVEGLRAPSDGGAGRPTVLGGTTALFFRPDLSLPAYAGLLPTDGVSPIYHFFDRVGGGRGFAGIVTRASSRDYRGGRLTYDEHDGTDFVCPPGTPLAAAAPGVVAAVRDRFLRGGLTASVDHGHGVVTQYTHLARMVAEVGEPLVRGQTVALSGSAGIDMISGFPWVPPHVHFMVWVHGEPVDPYLAAGEAPRAGVWLHGDDPRTSGPLDGDPRPPAAVPVDERALEAAIARCVDPGVAAELAGAPSPVARLALYEDSLHHDRDAWPGDLRFGAGRPAADPTRVRLTLPLPASLYRSARAADAPWTAPA